MAILEGSYKTLRIDMESFSKGELLYLLKKPGRKLPRNAACRLLIE